MQQLMEAWKAGKLAENVTVYVGQLWYKLICAHHSLIVACIVRKVIVFPVSSWVVTITKLSLAGNNLIIPGQGEFGL
jgi:hypothetical protein